VRSTGATARPSGTLGAGALSIGATLEFGLLSERGAGITGDAGVDCAKAGAEKAAKAATVINKALRMLSSRNQGLRW
jgi:hypothetical protein